VTGIFTTTPRLLLRRGKSVAERPVCPHCGGVDRISRMGGKRDSRNERAPQLRRPYFRARPCSRTSALYRSIWPASLDQVEERFRRTSASSLLCANFIRRRHSAAWSRQCCALSMASSMTPTNANTPGVPRNFQLRSSTENAWRQNLRLVKIQIRPLQNSNWATEG
jgi:hypothetical protein